MDLMLLLGLERRKLWAFIPRDVRVGVFRVVIRWMLPSLYFRDTELAGGTMLAEC